MKTIKVTKDVVTGLTRLCGKIQTIKNTRISPSSAISLLLRFINQNQKTFDLFIEKEKQRSFPKDYDRKLDDMRNSGIPITREFQSQTGVSP